MNANRQRGAALIVALVIVAMTTLLAATLVWENHLDRRRTANQLYGAEALANALSVEDFVRDVLAQDDRETDHLLEPWARQGDVFPIEGGSLSGSVIDLQGRFNVNNLVDESGNPVEDAVTRFRDLLLSIGLDPLIADSTLDWLDRNIDPENVSGAEDDVYLRNDPAYRTANHQITDASELRMVANMTPEQFAVLEPYVTALPDDAATRVNINTAPPELLVALGEDLAAEDAARIVEIRNQDGFTSIDDVESVIGQGKLPADVFTVQSNWFRLQVLAVIGSSRVTMYSVLHRDSETGAVRARSRSLGTP